MAYPLPHPDLNFVPLQVLTAKELSQILAKINKLAEAFPLTAANIAKNAITAEKLDWSAFCAKSTLNTTERNLSQSAITLASLDITEMPIGAKFVAIAQLQANVKSENINSVIARLTYGSTTYSSTFTNTWNTPLTVVGMFTKDSGSTIRLSGLIENSNPTVASSASILFLE